MASKKSKVAKRPRWWDRVLLVVLLVAVASLSYFLGTLRGAAPAATLPFEETPCQCKYAEMEPRSANPAYIDDLYMKEMRLKQKLEFDVENVETDEQFEALRDAFERWGSPEHQPVRWQRFLEDHTPTFGNARVNCSDVAAVTLSRPWAPQSASRLLTQCGFVVLSHFHPRQMIEAWKDSFDAFKEDSRASREFRYPCQGEGRYEYMVPWQEPFNSSSVYTDTRLLDILFEFFQGRFKLELQTVISSRVGSGNQRWHQGWPYLWHPEEKTPPYALVAGVPLVDVSLEMGPTEFCPGKKVRFYQGYSCSSNGQSLKIPSTLGDVILFDYWTLHRGPANAGMRERPMISLVYSKLWFMNQQALVNRGVSLLQTLHQRRYMEAFFWHPDSVEEMFVV